MTEFLSRCTASDTRRYLLLGELGRPSLCTLVLSYLWYYDDCGVGSTIFGPRG